MKRTADRIARRRGVSFCVVVLALMVSRSLLAANKPLGAPHGEMACDTCHLKKNPAPGDSVLRACPGNPPNEKQKLKTQSNEPSVVILNELVDKYDPVRFSHKSHADMAQMGDSCWLCHHNSPADRPHPACKTCHRVGIDRNNPSRLRLKAAYHRHCIDCHRKWSHRDDCLVCHAKRGKGPKVTLKKGLKSPYPRLKQPGGKVYRTAHEDTVVTFFHNDHTQLFRIPCEDCHKGASCVQCHDRVRAKPIVKPGHETCSGCHDVKERSQCAKCHRRDPMTAYNHNSTGFPLGVFHKKIKCGACHHAHQPIRKINRSCDTCHKGFKFKKFDHALTGFSLKPWHTRVQCANCHPVDQPIQRPNPNCPACHKNGLKKFNHAAVGFTLKSYHAGLKCEACHPAGQPMKPRSARCADCHKGMVFEHFDHASVGFALKRYHGKLSCDKCHPADKPFGRPAKQCVACHKEDVLKKINHGLAVGLILDELHGSLGCADCHAKGFEVPPDCSGCHKDKTYPKDKPGKEGAQ